MGEPFGKFYAKTFTGSMMGAGSDVIAVMAYAVSHAKPPDGVVELNPKYLSLVIGASISEMETAISFLVAPDVDSRTKTLEGRRLERNGQFSYRLVNWFAHRQGLDDESRKEYFRQKMAESRARKVNVKPIVKDTLTKLSMFTQAEAEAEASKSTALPRVRAPKFEKPTREELNLHAAKIGLASDEVDKFVNHYESNGWKVGRNQMKSWTHSLANWKNNQQIYGNHQQTSRNGAIDRSIGNVGYDPAAPNKAVRVLAAREAAREAERQAAENGVATPLA